MNLASSSSSNPNAAVISTDTDALVSRYSAIQLTYLSDPYTLYFLPPNLKRQFTSGEGNRRPPLINIGTHARTWIIDCLVDKFLSSGGDGGKRQVLSLGCGNDTRFLRLRDRFSSRGSREEGKEEWDSRVSWVEVDFEESTSKKARILIGKKELKDGLGDQVKVEKGGSSISSKNYTLIPGDLRQFSPSLGPALLAPNPFPSKPSPILDPSIPTLLLAECVFIYLPPESADQILSWFTKTFAKKGGSFVGYDPFNFEDNFGKVMIRNLATRSLELPAAKNTPTLDSLDQRLIKNGFAKSTSLTIQQIRERVIPKQEIQRVDRIERIDEVEELNLVLSHYAVTCGNLKGDEGVEFEIRSN